MLAAGRGYSAIDFGEQSQPAESIDGMSIEESSEWQ
jgi:hypothetical protein